MPDEIKQDVEKVAADVREVEGQVDAATQRALGAINRQASWIERHPRATFAIGVVLVLVVVVLAIKAL